MSAAKNVSSTVASAPATSAASKKTGNPKSAGSKAQNASVASHPTYADMIKKALTDLDDRKGTSRAAILKYVVQKFQVGSNMAMISAHLKQALKRGVATGALKQTKGTGASGSFRLGGKAAAMPKVLNTTKSPKKPAVRALKKVAAVTHKTKAKKSPKKAVSGASKKANVVPKKAALENAKAAPAKDTSTPSRAQSTKKSAASKNTTTPKKAVASKKPGAAKETAVSKKAAASVKKSPNKAVPKKTNSKKAAGDASSKA
ncbi:linker histone h1 and h5 family domain-containing protein [Ditylenchus destructor]|uniref:Linker histone h1 and h5 family domain-containing protein n=1 Tax=Ditylenchus destructor TaxID=166010 RepID=A0AAD4N697_9BILA|nr:linker histone h1 and h5 family domain-containing protein [Ditylenchus destructor]